MNNREDVSVQNEQINAIDEIKRAVEIFTARHNSGITEVRVLMQGSSPLSGFYDDLDKLSCDVAKLDATGKAKGIYITLNPVKSELLLRSANRLETAKTGQSTDDDDILHRNWLLIDFDVKRPANTNASNAEMEAAKEKVTLVRQWLTENEFPEALFACSGNGYHLNYQIDLLNDENSKNLVSEFLKMLQGKFADEKVDIDIKVYNASRITKLYGTTARKAANTVERPQRQAFMVNKEFSPKNAGVVSIELLQKLITENVTKTTTRQHKGKTNMCQIYTTSFDKNDYPEWTNNYREVILTGETNSVKDGWEFKCPICGISPHGSAIALKDGRILCRKSKCRLEDMARAANVDVDAKKRSYNSQFAQKNETGFNSDGEITMENEKQENINSDSSTNSINSTDSTMKTKGVKTTPLLGEKAFYGTAGLIVKAIAKESEASEAALLVQFLTAFGNVVGFEPFCWTEADKQGTNLFTLVVGKTARAGRKGTSWGHIEKLFRLADEIWATNCLESNFLASGEGLINRLKDRKDGENSGANDKRLLIVEGEFGKVLNLMKRSGDSLNSTLRNAFDRKTLGNGRSNDIDSKKATNPHLAMIGHITQNELKSLLNEGEVHNGFLNRFLIAFTERKQMLPLGGNFWRGDVTPYVDALKRSIEFSRGIDTEMPLSKEAEGLWCEIYESCAYDEEDGYIDAMTARAEPIMRRLQLIYAVLDNSKVVEVAHVEAAKAVWDYCEASVKYIFANGLRLSKDAEKLYKAVKGNPDGLNRTQQFDVFKNAKRITANLLDSLNDELRRAGLAETREVPTNGRNEKYLFDVDVQAMEDLERVESVESVESEPKAQAATN